MNSATKKIFVTVGSTHFDELISLIDSPPFISLAAKRGYSEIVAQVGNYGRPVQHITKSFAYAKPNEIKPYFQNSDLVIGHAGAGTIMEVLGLKKPLLVVVNDSLMENHQPELARALCSRNLLTMATISTFLKIFGESQFPVGQLTLNCDEIIRSLENHFGFS
jgi:beta-1,4-N-acetylglucosaminyltransferase